MAKNKIELFPFWRIKRGPGGLRLGVGLALNDEERLTTTFDVVDLSSNMAYPFSTYLKSVEVLNRDPLLFRIKADYCVTENYGIDMRHGTPVTMIYYAGTATRLPAAYRNSHRGIIRPLRKSVSSGELSLICAEVEACYALNKGRTLPPSLQGILEISDETDVSQIEWLRRMLTERWIAGYPDEAVEWYMRRKKMIE